MAKRQFGPLSPAQLGSLCEATLLNALEMIAEAEHLLDARRFARALALGVLAAEEFGKHLMSYGAHGRDAADEEFWKDFWSRYYDHAPKYTNAAMQSLILVDAHEMPSVGQTLREVAELRRRERGFYVEYVEGQFATPSEAISEEEAQTVVTAIGDIIRYQAHRLGEEESLVGRFVDSQEAAKVMIAALESEDPQRIESAWRETTGSDMPLYMRVLAGLPVDDA